MLAKQNNDNTEAQSYEHIEVKGDRRCLKPALCIVVKLM